MSRLAFAEVRAPGAEPAQWMLFLHGIMGSRANWRGIARRLCDRRPEWGAVLVDLRKHGDSQDFSPPHTVAAAARDLAELVTALDRPVHGIVGHSFGGKVALVSLAHRPQIRQAWLIDSMPGPDPGTTEPGSPRQVIATLFELEAPFASREAFVRALESRGIAAGVAHWLAMSLVEGPGGMRSRIDPAAVRELLADYAACDAWPTLEARTPGRSVHVIVAGRSTVWSAADRVRLAAAAARGTVTVHEMPDVGHWVHVEDPEGLVAILARGV